MALTDEEVAAILADPNHIITDEEFNDVFFLREGQTPYTDPIIEGYRRELEAKFTKYALQELHTKHLAAAAMARIEAQQELIPELIAFDKIKTPNRKMTIPEVLALYKDGKGSEDSRYSFEMVLAAFEIEQLAKEGLQQQLNKQG